MVSKTYSLRPPAVAKDGLDTLFRIEMKKDDLSAEGLKPGDGISIVSQSTGKGGVGIVSLSTETAKSQGNTSYVKIHPKLREFIGLELSDKCSITRFEGTQRRIKTINVSVSGNSKARAEDTQEDIAFRATAVLEQLPCIISGVSFTVNITNGIRSSRKAVLSIDALECEDVSNEENISIPFRFDLGFSKVVVGGISSQPTRAEQDATEVHVQPVFTGLPGLEVEIEQLSECVERVNRQLDDQWRQIAGCVPILLHGATGTGKSAILTQLAERAGWKNSLRLNHSDLSVSASKVKTIVANAFAEAVRSQPSLIILDDLHATAGRSEENVVARNVLFESIQDLRGSKVQVVAAARRPIDVDQKLLACFREKIELPTPTPTSRLKILSHFSHALSDEVTLKWVAEKTHAYTATDLDNLCFAALRAAETRGSRYHKSLTNGDHGEGHRSVLVKADLYTPPTITLDDFHQALRFVHPSLIDDLYIEVPKVYWSDIAGSSEVKQKLYEAAELPLKHPEVLAQLQMHVNHGILLYGPPGCSKTMTAKALATESGLNFIAVKGPELVSKYVGESEYKIREIFRKARAASPSVIFFDEIDSIAPNREGGGGHEGLNTVATLLNEMDGVEDVQRVLVLAATNRPDAIDPALLRPGRLGTSLYVGPPNYDAVLEILKTRTSRMGGKKSMLHLASTAAQMVENGCFSGADVGAVCDAAGMLCAVEAVKQGTPIDDIAVRQEHLDQALASAKPSLSKRQLAFLQKWSVGQSESGE